MSDILVLVFLVGLLVLLAVGRYRQSKRAGERHPWKLIIDYCGLVLTAMALLGVGLWLLALLMTQN